MKIREASEADVSDILNLFESTIRSVNAKDYTPEQIEVWASAKDKETWSSKIKDQWFYVAISDHHVVGFSSIDKEGYLDFMYVHKDHQGKGIASSLLDTIESTAIKIAINEICSSVSKTAKPFFLSKGYKRVKTEIKEIKGITFENNWMIKKFDH